jgi:hypothetical protein
LAGNCRHGQIGILYQTFSKVVRASNNPKQTWVGFCEAALRAGRFPAMAETLRLYRSIATMDKEAPLPSLRSQKPTWDKAAVLAQEWELDQLARRLEELEAHG